MIAEFIPRSVKIVINCGATRTTANKPYSLGGSMRAKMIMLMPEITVEAASPQKMLKPPLAEVLAIVLALLNMIWSLVPT